MKQWGRACFLAVMLAGGIASAEAVESTTYRFDDWQVVCQQDDEHHNLCTMSQQGIDRKSGRQIYQVAVSFPDGSGQPRLDVLVPLGVSLPFGVRIEVDKGAGAPFNMRYRYCVGSGCLAETNMNQKMLDAFRHGHKASIHVQDQNKKDLALPISLKGYTKAFSKLEANRKKR